MKKDSWYFKIKEILFVFFIALSFLTNAQNHFANYLTSSLPQIDNSNSLLGKTSIPVNLWGMDFSMLSSSVHYARKIGSDWYVGAEIGILPEKFDWVIAGGKRTTQENTIWSKDRKEAQYNDLEQIFFIQGFVRWKPNIQWIEAEGGIKWSVVSLDYYYLDGLWIPSFFSTYIKPTFGLRRIKVGFRLEAGFVPVYDYGHKKEFVSIFSPLVRFNFK